MWTQHGIEAEATADFEQGGDGIDEEGFHTLSLPDQTPKIHPSSPSAMAASSALR